MLVETLHRLQPLRDLPAIVQYAATALIVFAFFGLRYLIAGLGLDPAHLPLFVTFMPAVILSSLLFVRGAGFFSVALSALLGVYFMEGRVPLAGALRLGVFLAAGIFAAAIVGALRRSVSEMFERSNELATARAALEDNLERLRSADAQKELLLHDTNHRIKNHLQLVSGYILLGQRDVGDPRAAGLLGSAASRLKVLARVYDRLQLRRDSTSVSARGFIEELVNDLQPTIVGMRPIVLQAEAEVAELSSSRAVTLGLMINELVTNAVRFAFAEDEPGTVVVLFRHCAGGFCLEVIDDGAGFRSEARSGSLGQRMLRALVQQLGGTIDWSGPPGTRVSVTFPEEQQNEVMQ